MTKRVRLATFATSIVDNLCLLQRNKWNTIKIRSLVERLVFWQLGTQFSGRCCCGEVAVSGGSTLRTSFETHGSYLDEGGGGG